MASVNEGSKGLHCGLYTIDKRPINPAQSETAPKMLCMQNNHLSWQMLRRAQDVSGLTQAIEGMTSIFVHYRERSSTVLAD